MNRTDSPARALPAARLAAAALAIGAVLFPIAAAAGSADLTAREIVARANAAFLKAKTYQVVYRARRSLADVQSAPVEIEIKTVPNKKLKMVVSPADNSASHEGMVLTDDGVTVLMYYPASKEFVTERGWGDRIDFYGQMFSNFGILLGSLNPERGAYTLRPPSVVRGHPVYVINAVPTNPGPDFGSMTILIDQTTFRIRQVKMVGHQGAQAVSLITTLVSDTVNGPIPAAVFDTKPPAGAKQIEVAADGTPAAPGPGKDR